MSRESSRTSADPRTPDFGANEWLVDELYQKYLEDPNSVDQAWWNFFADYQPGSRPATAQGAVTVTPAAPSAPAPAPAPDGPAARPAAA
ncbi:MAG TPA: hypothetical protein VHJ17_18755, partial [Thermomonospora sp.]|nr:hypothetical protein [Thermomonospora sp.]